jgi:hypothetical protein
MCSVKIDMTGNGIAGRTEPPPTPAPPSSVFVPYRPDIQQGVMDMGAFVNDLRAYWPRKKNEKTSSGSRASASAVMTAAISCLVTVAVCVSWTP